MASRLSLCFILVAITISGALAPAVATHGAWSGFAGMSEPNTKWDTAAFMPQRPNQAPVEKVYFNGMVISAGPAGYSREIELDGGNTLTPDGYYFVGVLGYWRDCNRDGYIGAKVLPASYGNFATYPRAVVTIDERLCPLGTAYNPVNKFTSQPDAFIDEFRWIGPLAGCDPYEAGCPGNNIPGAKLCIPPSNPNSPVCLRLEFSPTDDPSDVTDNTSKVWADWSYPGGAHVYDIGYTTQSPGTYETSHGTMTYVDDVLGRAFSQSLGDTWTDAPNVGECDDTPELAGGPTQTCGLYPLYQVKRLANDGNAEIGEGNNPSPLVQVFDTENDSGGSQSDNPCDDFVSQYVDVHGIPVGVSGGTLHVAYVGLADVDPRVHPNFLVEGSVAGTYGNVLAGTNATNINNKYGECGSDDTATAQLESNARDSEFVHRKPADNLSFVRDSRQHVLGPYGFDNLDVDVLSTMNGPQSVILQSTNGGSFFQTFGGPGWFGRARWLATPPRHGWGYTSVAHATFYADVTNQGLSRAGAIASSALPGGVQNRHTYGAEFCTTFTTGPSNVNPANDWECSVAEWRQKRQLDDPANTNPQRPILGDRYDLRDVDCFDNTVSDSMLGPDVRLGANEGCGATH